MEMSIIGYIPTVGVYNLGCTVSFTDYVYLYIYILLYIYMYTYIIIYIVTRHAPPVLLWVLSLRL